VSLEVKLFAPPAPVVSLGRTYGCSLNRKALRSSLDFFRGHDGDAMNPPFERKRREPAQLG
jgi:hypothetical protein